MQLPSSQVVRAVIQRYARLVTRLAGELGERPLVLPTGEFFPDRFVGDEPSVQKLVARMQLHAGVSDIPIKASVIADGGEPRERSSCSSGACSVPMLSAHGVERLVDEGDGWRLQLLEAELRHPVVLSTNIARSLAYVFLVETQEDDEIIEPPVDITADMAAVALGLGAIMMQGSYIYAKSCGGPSVARVTKLSCAELAVAFSAFITRGAHPIRSVLKELDATQHSLLSDAHQLFASNRELCNLLRTNPARVARGDFELSEGKPWLSRFFNKKQPLPEQDPLDALAAGTDLEELENLLVAMPPSSAARRPSRPPASSRRDELKELVADALGPARAEAK